MKSNKRLFWVAAVSFLIFLGSVAGVFFTFFAGTKRGVETIEIPSYVGRRFSEIEASPKFSVEHELVYSNTVPEGEVISQYPYAGARRKLGLGERYPVKLTVSLGEERMQVPNLENYSYLEAAAALRSLGTRIRIVWIYDDEMPPDTVLHTAPKAGEGLAPGQTVTLFVSRLNLHGSICVRDFTGLLQEEACAEIFADGLLIGEIEAVLSDEYAEGVVLSQSLAEGIYVRHGSRIDLTVSAGPPKEEIHPFGRYVSEGSDNGD